MGTTLGWLFLALILLGGIIAASGIILAKKPDAKELLNKITPYQGIIGVALLAAGVYSLIKYLDALKVFLHFDPLLPSLTWLAWQFGSIILGFILGMPLIAKWIPGESDAEQKVVNIQRKLIPFQGIFGIIGLVDGVLLLLYQIHILK